VLLLALLDLAIVFGLMGVQSISPTGEQLMNVGAYLSLLWFKICFQALGRDSRNCIHRLALILSFSSHGHGSACCWANPGIRLSSHWPGFRLVIQYLLADRGYQFICLSRFS